LSKIDYIRAFSQNPVFNEPDKLILWQDEEEEDHEVAVAVVADEANHGVAPSLPVVQKRIASS
jgi:hypothetical protein